MLDKGHDACSCLLMVTVEPEGKCFDSRHQNLVTWQHSYTVADRFPGNRKTQNSPSPTWTCQTSADYQVFSAAPRMSASAAPLQLGQRAHADLLAGHRGRLLPGCRLLRVASRCGNSYGLPRTAPGFHLGNRPRSVAAETATTHPWGRLSWRSPADAPSDARVLE